MTYAKRWKKSTKQEKTNAKNLGCFLILILAFVFASILTSASKTPKQILDPRGTPKKHSLIQKVMAEEKTVQSVPAKDVSYIKNYIRQTFQENGEIAIAVATGECHLDPNCENKNGEYSIGIFQINLRAHFDKVPGNTLEEKEAWLKVPENNILMARAIYVNSGWYPWTSFTSGRYINYL